MHVVQLMEGQQWLPEGISGVRRARAITPKKPNRCPLHYNRNFTLKLRKHRQAKTKLSVIQDVKIPSLGRPGSLGL